MERNNNITPGFNFVSNMNNITNNSESNDLCEDCYMRNQHVKAEFTCTECKVNICINCSVRQHKQHADKFHNIYEYVEQYEGEYFNNHLTNLQVLGMEIKELFDKECEPLDLALSEHLKEGKKRKEVLEHLQHKLRSLAEEEDILQNEVLCFLSQEKKTRKQKQKKLEESVKKALRYIEFHTEKVLKTKSIQERALDINTDFLKEDSEKIQEAYTEELKNVQGNGYSKKINSLTNQTTAILDYENKIKTVENEIAELYKNYQLAITNFKKEARIPEGVPRSMGSDLHSSFENRRSLNSSNANPNIGFNPQNGFTPRDDVDMVNANSSLNQSRNPNANLNENRSEFSLFDSHADQADNDSRIPKYPSFNNENPRANINSGQQNTKNTTSSKDLIYHNQTTQNNPSLNLNPASFAASIAPSAAAGSPLDASNLLGSAAAQQSSLFGSVNTAANQSQNYSQNPSSNFNSTQKIPVVNNSGINLAPDSTSVQNQNNNANNIAVSANTYFIGIKSKPNNEIVVFNSFTNTIKTLKIDESCYNFEDGSASRPANFPYENSKYVNIGGNSAVITGGNIQKSPSDHVYRLTITAPQEPNLPGSLQSERVQITKWPNMLTKRERHNILFLADVNQVLVCSGFYVKSCEYIEITGNANNNLNNSREVKKWKKLPELAEPRGNATMFYLNNRFVYVLGGFKVNDSTGEYLNSLEYMDLLKKDKWNFVNIETLTRQHSLRISAMGCVGLGNDRILLVGGYDGSSYLRSGFAVEFEDGVVKGFEKKENLLPRGSIFFSNPMFMKINENVLFNFELQAKAIVYDEKKGEFQFFSQPQPQA